MNAPTADLLTCPNCKARKPTNFSHSDPCPECGFRPAQDQFNPPLTIPFVDAEGNAHVFEGCYVKSVEYSYPEGGSLIRDGEPETFAQLGAQVFNQIPVTSPPRPTLMGETSEQVILRLTLKRAEDAEAKLAVIDRIVTDAEGAVPGDTLSTVRYRQAHAYRRILNELRPRPVMGVKT